MLLRTVQLPELEAMYSAKMLHSEPTAVPIFVHTKTRDVRGPVRIPMWEYLTFWAVETQEKVDRKSPTIPWEERVETLFWRGSESSCSENLRTWDMTPRVRLATLSKFTPSMMNAKLTEVPAAMQTLYSMRNMTAEHSLINDQLQYKYLVDIDGITQSNRLYWLLLSNSLTFRVNSSLVSWFSDQLEPYVHFIPVRHDLSDVVDQILWARAHDKECHNIALRAREFALARLTQEHALHYLYRLLVSYSKLQAVATKRVQP